ncbi:hypothetical protein RI129_009076 [Pyrocoelia pectoralis]|uniref:Nucleoside diphosphate kinase n=1 Tax=Pyrocoelia pectoralis TaxID=417401 RepID=A0AAN7VB17_9COLE
MSDVRERTFIMIKPDGVQRTLVGKIIKRFESKGLKLVGIKLIWEKEEMFAKHYADLAGRKFFSALVKYMSRGPVVPMVWEGLHAVEIGRVILGQTCSEECAPGTIRGDFSIQGNRNHPMGRNVVHGSDSVESAKREIDLWFAKNEIVEWKSAMHSWIYEEDD